MSSLQDGQRTLLRLPSEIEKDDEIRLSIVELEDQIAKLLGLSTEIEQFATDTSFRYRVELARIQDADRRELEGLHLDHSEQFQSWLGSGKDHGEIETVFNQELDDETVKLWRKLVRESHPQNDPDGVKLAVYQAAVLAKENGERGVILALANHLAAGEEDLISRYSGLDREELLESRGKLEEAVESLLKQLEERYILGLSVGKYIDRNSQLETDRLLMDIGTAIHSRLREIAESGEEVKDERELPPVELSDSTALSLGGATSSLKVVPPEEQLALAQSGISGILARFEQLVPYSREFYSGGIRVEICQSQSRYGDKVYLEIGGSKFHYYVKDNPDNRPFALVYKGSMDIDAVEFFIDGEGELHLSEDDKEPGELLSIVNKMEAILSLPLRSVRVNYKDEAVPILDSYGEQIFGMAEPLPMNQVLFSRLLRGLLLLKLPRQREVAVGQKTYIYIPEMVESFEYDGRFGELKEGTEVEWEFEEAPEGWDGRTKFSGVADFLDDHFVKQDLFREALGYGGLELKGTVTINGEELPMLFRLDGRPAGELIQTLRPSWIGRRNRGGEFSAQLGIGGRLVTFSFDASREPEEQLKMEGMQEELLADLLFSIVEGGKVTDLVYGDRYDLEKGCYLREGGLVYQPEPVV